MFANLQYVSKDIVYQMLNRHLENFFKICMDNCLLMFVHNRYFPD